jgi:hypothetical protein
MAAPAPIWISDMRCDEGESSRVLNSMLGPAAGASALEGARDSNPARISAAGRPSKAAYFFK